MCLVLLGSDGSGFLMRMARSPFGRTPEAPELLFTSVIAQGLAAWVEHFKFMVSRAINLGAVLLIDSQAYQKIH